MWRYERPALAGCLALVGLCGAAAAALLCAGLALGLPGLNLQEASASTPEGIEAPAPTRPPGPPPTSVVVPLGEIVLEEDFADPGGGWLQNADEFTTHAYDDGAYRIAVHQPNYDAWAYAGLDLTDARLSVQAEAFAGPADRAFGLICRLQDDHNYYAAYVTADGWAALFRKQNDDFVSLLPGDWVETDAVRASDRNDLGLDCLGDRLLLSVNGVVVAQAEDSTFARGDVGLLAATFDEAGANVRFDNFVVREP
jgi:hypothetical protein